MSAAVKRSLYRGRQADVARAEPDSPCAVQLRKWADIDAARLKITVHVHLGSLESEPWYIATPKGEEK